MSKTIKHLNVLRPNPGPNQSGFEYLLFVCRGCTMRNRGRIWRGFASSPVDPLNREIDNSYLIFEEEPCNPSDPNAIMVTCRGEFFGTVGYVGREYTSVVKDILSKCKNYRIDMSNLAQIGNSEIDLVLTWTPLLN